MIVCSIGFWPKYPFNSIHEQIRAMKRFVHYIMFEQSERERNIA